MCECVTGIKIKSQYNRLYSNYDEIATAMNGGDDYNIFACLAIVTWKYGVIALSSGRHSYVCIVL